MPKIGGWWICVRCRAACPSGDTHGVGFAVCVLLFSVCSTPSSAWIFFTRGMGYEWLTAVWGMGGVCMVSCRRGAPRAGYEGIRGASPSRHTPSGAHAAHAPHNTRTYTPCLRRRAPPSFPPSLPPSRSPY
eukprot:7169889-Prymnesium_polylepis.1